MSTSLLHLAKPENLEIKYLLDSYKEINIRGNVSFINPQTGRRNKRMKLRTFEPKNLYRYTKYCYWFIDRLWQKRIFNQDEYSSNSTYINLSRDSIGLGIPEDSIDLVKNLLKFLNVIEENSSYSNRQGKSFAKSYRLTDEYRDSLLSFYELKDAGLLAKISKARDVEVFKMPEHIQFQYWQLTKLNFLKDDALRDLNYALSQKIITSTMYNMIYYSILQLSNNYKSFSWESDWGRLFHPISNCPRILRPYLRDENGESMVLVDYSASLPCHFYKFCLDVFSSESEFNFDRDKLKLELDEFKYLLETSTLYDEVAKMMSLDTDIKEGVNVSRDTAKDLLLRKWLNVKVRGETDHTRTINQKFPEMTNIKNQVRSSEYKKLYRLLMNSESKLVNEIVVKGMMKELNQPNFYTIHDAFIIDKNNAPKLKEIMQEEGRKFLGLNIKVKDEILDESYYDYQKYRMKKFYDEHYYGDDNLLSFESNIQWFNLVDRIYSNKAND
ncbi:MAG: hypothetical protein ABJQ37_19965 [Reichenbachiella sp.]|uniref:hypothetical protein n=1 Tax=Reichenbachiella sp. TaxID=2184521 RepID=UPI003299AA9A